MISQAQLCENPLDEKIYDSIIHRFTPNLHQIYTIYPQVNHVFKRIIYTVNQYHSSLVERPVPAPASVVEMRDQDRIAVLPAIHSVGTCSQQDADCKKAMRGTQPESGRILLIDDDVAMTRAVGYNLGREGYEVVVATDGQEGLEKARTISPDLVILEVALPVLDGLDVCRELRAEAPTRDLPILMLTVKAEEADQMAGFSVGADDYVTKPFSMKVFLQRVRALLRRARVGVESAHVINHLGIEMNRSRHAVTYRGEELRLTLTEFRLLECLLRQPGRAFTRQQLLDAAIGPGTSVLDRTIDLHVKAVRRKLGNPDIIETVRGVGYRLQTDITES